MSNEANVASASQCPVSAWTGRIFTGLAGKLTLVFTALVLAFVVATVAINALGQRADQRQRVLLNANHLIALTKEVSIPHILAGRPSELEIFFEELEKRTDVDSILMVDPNGALLMAGQSVGLPFLSQVDDPRIQEVLETEERQVNFGPDALTIVGPVKVADDVIGVAKIALNLKDLAASTKAFWVSNLTLGALFLVFGLIASRLLANKLASPLEKLANAANKVAEGDLDQHVELHSADEFSQVADAFNGMLSNLKRSIGEIHRVAYEDKLTGAPNRSWLNMQLEQLTLRYKHAETGFAVIFLDLDKFKAVNDTYGHHVGDQLLRAFSKRLARCLREEGLVVRSVDYHDNRGLNVEAGEAILARLGGDEFTLIVPLEAAETVAKRITRAMEAPFRLEGCQLNNSTSMGIAVFPLHAVTREHLLKCADVAMYQAKRSPNNSYAYYNHATHTRIMERTALERDLETAISEQAFDMVLQAQRTVESGKLVGAEALIRWCHPERGMVPPSEFLPIAASNGMLPAIGRIMMDRAIQIAAQVNTGRQDKLTIAVNIGIEELNEDGFAPSIIAMLEKHGTEPSWLEIEITESTAMEESGLVDHQVAILSNIGVRFAIDDFGMGYSNLGRMRALAFQTLKLDRSLMIGLGEDPASEHLVATIMDMAQAIGADVVAEGIETMEQLEVLKRRGCGTYQGYFGGRPMPADDFVAMVDEGADQQLKIAS